ncbi:MAG TPA: hypothetical protein ENH82_02705 [bacterium]|nr:hypothetical protein [bacterium]
MPKFYRVETHNACFGVATDDLGFILRSSFTAPIAKRHIGKHIDYFKQRFNANIQDVSVFVR